MKKFEKMLKAEILEIGELDDGGKSLVMEALMARAFAQAPYSNFFVGAAARSGHSEKIYTGCNVERCTYTQTTHAEQAAIDKMVCSENSGRSPKIKKIAIMSGPENFEFSMWPPAEATEERRKKWRVSVPCGHCLQIIWENCHGDENVEILDFNPATRAVTKITIGNAFPFRFGPKDLGVDYSKPART